MADRLLRRAVLVFFGIFPGIFGGIPVFWGGGLPHGISLYEGVHLLGLVFGTVLSGAFAFRQRGADPFECRKRRDKMIWTDIFRPKIRGFFVLGSAFFLLSVSIHAFAPFSDILTGHTYSTPSFVLIGLLTFSFSRFPQDVRSDAVRAMIFGFSAINFPYAVLQYWGYDPVTAHVVLPWNGADRAFGTLGNPNSLAFFAAMAIPLAFALFQKGTLRFILIVALAAILVLSGSWSAMSCGLAYLSYQCFRPRPFFILASIATVLLLWGIASRSDKLFSLETRGAIIAGAVEGITTNPKTFLVGSGAGAVENWFSHHRSSQITRLVDVNVPIDRTHFVWLDIAFAFGVPVSVAILSFLVLVFGKTEKPVREVLSVFLILSCVHTPMIAQWVLLTTALLLRGDATGLPAPKRRQDEPRAWKRVSSLREEETA